MSGWLSSASNWTSKLDNIKSQVSNMAKEVFVEDEDGEGGEGGATMEEMSEGDILKELHRRCAYLEKLNKETEKDKEEQCENFRQLLLEKEEEIDTLQQMIDTGQESEDPGGQNLVDPGGQNLEDSEGQDSGKQVQESAETGEDSKLNSLMTKNKKLLDQIKEVRAKLKEKDSKLKTATIELIEKEKYRCESQEKCNFIQDQFSQLEERLKEQSAENDKYKKDVDGKDSEMNELLEKMVAKDAEIEEMQTMQELEFQGLKNLLKEKDIKLKETIANHALQIKCKEDEHAEKITELIQQLEESANRYSELEHHLTIREAEFNNELQSMAAKVDEVNHNHAYEVENLQQQIERLRLREEVDSLEDGPSDTIAEEDVTMLENEEIKQVNEDLSKEIKELNDQVENSKADILLLENENKQLKEELKMSEEKSNESKTLLDKLDEESANKIDKSEYDEVYDQVKYQQEELSSLQQQLTSLQENNELLNNQIKDKETKLDIMKEDLKQKEKTMAKQKEQDSQNKKEIVALINENKELKDNEKQINTNGKNSPSKGRKSKKVSQEDDILDITNLVTENRELKDKLNSILCDQERSRIGERKLEAGELSILLKMKNLDLEHKYNKVQEENTNLSVENFDLRSKSGASSVISFPSSCNDPDYKLKSPSEEYSPGFPDKLSPGPEQSADLCQLLSEKDSLREKNKELVTKISEMENENQSLRQVLEENNKLDTKLKDDLTNISVECEKLKQEMENVDNDNDNDVDGSESRLTPVEPVKTEESYQQSTKKEFQLEIEKLNQTIIQMKERLRAVNKNLFDAADKDFQIEQLKEELAVKETELQALNEKETLLNDQLNVLTQQVNERDEGLKDSVIEITALKADKDSLKESVESVREELMQSREENITRQHDLQSIRIELAEAEKQVTRNVDLEDQLKHSIEKYEDLKVESETLAEKLASEKEDLLKQMRENDLKFNGKENYMTHLKDVIVQKENDISALNTKAEELNQALSDLKGMNEMFLNTAREKEKELNISKKLSLHLQKEKEVLEVNLEKVSTECNQLKEQIEDSQAKCTNFAGEVSRLEAELAERLETTEQLSRELQMAHSVSQEESPLVQVLNEKSKELAEARNQIQHYIESLQQERDRVSQLEEQQVEMRSSYAEMQGEGLKRLTCMVRDKELEMSSLQEKHQSILQLLDQERSNQQKLELENQELKLLSETLQNNLVDQERMQKNINSDSNCDIENQQLKAKIIELEKKLEKNVVVKESPPLQDQSNLEAKLFECTQKLSHAQQQILRLQSTSDNQLAEKSVEFTSEVERLRTDLKTLAQDRNSIECRLKSKEKEVVDLHKEVKSVIEKKKWVEGELERLRKHLVSVEETYTQELVMGEERETELRGRVGKLEDQVKRASMSHSEASQEANEAATHLTEALTAAASTRDTLSEQLKVSQTKLREKTSSLRNLQLALEGFQKQKEREIILAERKCHSMIEIEQTKCKEMEDQLSVAKKQLSAANEGLEAASRMSQQLDLKQHHIAALKHEISTMEELLQDATAKVKVANTAQVGKVDRDLVKNLILGYVTADNNKRSEILRIIATVLDFSQEDRGRTGLDGENRGWLGGFLASNKDFSTSNAKINQSIAQAFVKFLEEESVPQQAVQLPVLEMARRQQEQMLASGASPRSTPSPLLLNSLPTFSPTSTILRSVLDDKQEDNH